MHKLSDIKSSISFVINLYFASLLDNTTLIEKYLGVPYFCLLILRHSLQVVTTFFSLITVIVNYANPYNLDYNATLSKHT